MALFHWEEKPEPAPYAPSSDPVRISAPFCSHPLPHYTLLAHTALPAGALLLFLWGWSSSKEPLASCPLHSSPFRNLTFQWGCPDSSMQSWKLCLDPCFFPLVKMHEWTCLANGSWCPHDMDLKGSAESERSELLSLRQWENVKVCIVFTPSEGVKTPEIAEIWARPQCDLGSFKNGDVSHSDVNVFWALQQCSYVVWGTLR